MLSLKQKLAIRSVVLEELNECTPPQTLIEEIYRLRCAVAELKKTNSDLGWQLYPEAMGR